MNMQVGEESESLDPDRSTRNDTGRILRSYVLCQLRCQKTRAMQGEGN